MGEVDHHIQMKPHAKFEYFWTLGRHLISICKFEWLSNIGKSLAAKFSPAQWLQ
jgi:hypothetical protein